MTSKANTTQRGTTCGVHRLGSSALAACFGLALFAACGVYPKGTCDETSTCPPDDAGSDVVNVGDAPVDAPEGCDPNADPKDAPKCVDDSFGVFVDTTGGSDSNVGTKQSPLKSINSALGKLAGKARVYVCAGTYAEHVKTITNASVFGGFACGTWAYDASKPKVAPADAGYALEVTGASGTIADIEFVAQPGTSTSVSSVAVLIANSPQLTLRRVKIEAGAALKGDDGADALSGVSTPASYDGIIGTASAGGALKSCACSTGGTSKGAKGGDPSGPEPDGATGEIAQVPPTSTGAGGTRSDCELNGTGVGRPGSDAPPASSASAPSLGTLDATGWHPGDGSAGNNGVPGQGGGGGGSYAKGMPAQNGGGGGGACGGCGGGGGGGGKGGGASIAVLSVQSTVTLQASELVTANAGAGGRGKSGMSGAGGGIHGNPGNGACAGGNGGTGGAGGAGSGGAGGLSVGVLSKGPKPTLDTTTVTNGDKGAAGAGGGGNNGPDGQKSPTLELQ